MATKELIGKVIIQENIDTVDENKIPKTFVINVPDPFESYYRRFTDINKQISIIIVIYQHKLLIKIIKFYKK